jgi:transglutaminase-like putative cysteine protease
VSRGDFRVTVDDPRPASAWAMVTFASASLWITQQLDLWAVAAQALALLYSLLRRTDPHPWQRSPLVLNFGMIGIVAGTIMVALRGEPSTIALAHFAATTQGLQLLDARPRRTEFLLVALALFQVVLAANLTDSVFFTPLLIAFLFATVWTLIVHTLRGEAIEAGVARDTPRALTPALLRTTMLACVAALAIAMVLFVTLPRLRSSVVKGSAIGGSVATAGFSDRVEFGELGRIRQDPTVVMRVETLSGDPPRPEDAYWRGLAFDRFDGTAWSIDPPERRFVPGSAEGGVSFGNTPQVYDLEQRIVREPVAAGVLFRVGDPRTVQGTIRVLERDSSGGLYAAGQAEERVRYTLRSARRRWGDPALRSDRAGVPPKHAERYLQRPKLAPAFTARALEMTRGQPSDADRVRAIERTLRTEGRYTDVPPARDPEAPLSPVEAFVLGEVAGHCEYFASAMVLLVRANGIPARLVNGFAGGHANPIGGFVELTRSDAHAWVEVHYERAGWVRYDPTPPDLRVGDAEALDVAARFRQAASALELWWFQRVVGFDRADQIGALKSAWVAWKGRSPHTNRIAGWKPGERRSPLQGSLREVVLILASVGVAAMALGLLWRMRQRRSELPLEYARALRLLRRRGLRREQSATARGFACEVRARMPAAAEPFASLTEAYLAHRFGDRPFEAPADALPALRAALKTPAPGAPNQSAP